MGNQTTEKLKRWLAILELIPRHSRKITVSEIVRDLEARQMTVVPRTVQKDLSAISEFLAIVSDGDEGSTAGRPNGWSWAADAPQQIFPAMEYESALILCILNEHGHDLLPPRFHERLEPLFASAEATMRRIGRGGDARGDWVSRIAMSRPVIRQAVPRHRPAPNPEHERIAYEAVMSQRALKITYQSRHRGEQIKGEVYPIGLDCQPNKITLVVQFKNRKDSNDKYGEDYVQLPLHRIKRIELLDEQVPRFIQQNHDMRKFHQQHQGELPRPWKDQPGHGESIKLVASVSGAMLQDFRESPISDDQQLDELDGAFHRVSATVSWTQNLEWWLLSMVPDLVVEEPVELRELIQAHLKEGLRGYEDSAD